MKIDTELSQIFETENPFIDRVDDPWNDYPDNENFNKKPSKILSLKLKQIEKSSNKASIGITILGEAGTGKTHFLMRVVRNHSKINPVMFIRRVINKDTIFNHIWKSIIRSLIKPIRSIDKQDGHNNPNLCQLDIFLTKIFLDITKKIILKEISEKKLTKDRAEYFKKFLDKWEKNPYDTSELLRIDQFRNRIERLIINSLRLEFPEIDLEIVKAFFKYFYIKDKNRKRDIQLWLEGQELEDRRLKNLGLSNWLADLVSNNESNINLLELKEVKAQRAIQTISYLSLHYGHPLILCFDQLESLRSDIELLKKFSDVVREIFTRCSNFVIITSIFPNMLELFKKETEQSFTDRITSSVIRLESLDLKNASEILKLRLSEIYSSCDIEQKEQFYPFEENDIPLLLYKSPISKKTNSVRHFLKNCNQAWEYWVVNEIDDRLNEENKRKFYYIYNNKGQSQNQNIKNGAITLDTFNIPRENSGNGTSSGFSISTYNNLSESSDIDEKEIIKELDEVYKMNIDESFKELTEISVPNEEDTINIIYNIIKLIIDQEQLDINYKNKILATRVFPVNFLIETDQNIKKSVNSDNSNKLCIAITNTVGNSLTYRLKNLLESLNNNQFNNLILLRDCRVKNFPNKGKGKQYLIDIFKRQNNFAIVLDMDELAKIYAFSSCIEDILNQKIQVKNRALVLRDFINWFINNKRFEDSILFSSLNETPMGNLLLSAKTSNPTYAKTSNPTYAKTSNPTSVSINSKEITLSNNILEDKEKEKEDFEIDSELNTFIDPQGLPMAKNDNDKNLEEENNDKNELAYIVLNSKKIENQRLGYIGRLIDIKLDESSQDQNKNQKNKNNKGSNRITTSNISNISSSKINDIKKKLRDTNTPNIFNSSSNVSLGEKSLSKSKNSTDFDIINNIDLSNLNLDEQLKTKRLVALSLDTPIFMSFIGYPGSGKSYAMGIVIENAVLQPPYVLSQSEKRPAVIIFNYRKAYRARNEYPSMKQPNDNEKEISLLEEIYNLKPKGIEDLNIITYRSNIRTRAREYQDLDVYPISFLPEELDAENWLILLQPPNKNAVYIKSIKRIIRNLRDTNNLTIVSLRQQILQDQYLSQNQKKAALQKLQFVEEYVNDARNFNWIDIIKPGSINVFDLREQLIESEDALAMVIVLVNIILNSEDFTQMDKIIVFDEAHEYFNNKKLVDKLDNMFSQFRHHGISSIIATQYPENIPQRIFRYVKTHFLFNISNVESFKPIKEKIPDLRNIDVKHLLNLPRNKGICYIITNDNTTDNILKSRCLFQFRPKITKHGGQTAQNLYRRNRATKNNSSEYNTLGTIDNDKDDNEVSNTIDSEDSDDSNNSTGKNLISEEQISITNLILDKRYSDWNNLNERTSEFVQLIENHFIQINEIAKNTLDLEENREFIANEVRKNIMNNLEVLEDIVKKIGKYQNINLIDDVNFEIISNNINRIFDVFGDLRTLGENYLSLQDEILSLLENIQEQAINNSKSLGRNENNKNENGYNKDSKSENENESENNELSDLEEIFDLGVNRAPDNRKHQEEEPLFDGNQFKPLNHEFLDAYLSIPDPIPELGLLMRRIGSENEQLLVISDDSLINQAKAIAREFNARILVNKEIFDD